jgi:ABC-type antimicrobial peptide transport system ATPase subunit
MKQPHRTVLVLDHGRICESGSTAMVFEHPSYEHTRRRRLVDRLIGMAQARSRVHGVAAPRHVSA